MSNYFENSDLWKADTFSEELAKLTNENFFNPDLSDTKTREIMSGLKAIVADEKLQTEDLTFALSYLGDMVAMHPDKETAKEAVDILNMAIDHPNSGFTSGKNEDLDPYKYKQYYEIDSDVEARNVATLILRQQPDMEEKIFNIYEKLAEKELPVYHDLVEIAPEHPKAINLFEKFHNKDNIYDNLYYAASAMRNLMKENPQAISAVERMVDNFNQREKTYVKGEIVRGITLMKKVLRGTGSYEKNTPEKYEELNTISTKKRIEQLKVQAGIGADKEAKKSIPIDRLEQKMQFIEKRVKMFKEREMGGNTDDLRKIEDNVRLTAYKEFSQTTR